MTEEAEKLKLSRSEVWVVFEEEGDVCLDGYFTREDLLKIAAAMEPAK